mmetsp:Transcript_24603/g.54092  ORF Transcript_24603/g.54092 Transcript_24603/m.54092 type:complete len:220 (-) Transcript_24603:441-1100(-)
MCLSALLLTLKRMKGSSHSHCKCGWSKHITPSSKLLLLILLGYRDCPADLRSSLMSASLGKGTQQSKNSSRLQMIVALAMLVSICCAWSDTSEQVQVASLSSHWRYHDSSSLAMSMQATLVFSAPRLPNVGCHQVWPSACEWSWPQSPQLTLVAEPVRLSSLSWLPRAVWAALEKRSHACLCRGIAKLCSCCPKNCPAPPWPVKFFSATSRDFSHCSTA